ncbi:MAG: MFS transporter [Verrucomicrobia bacterium]|nr:MFS transporter [Verrucomicrobiota bacterium]
MIQNSTPSLCKTGQHPGPTPCPNRVPIIIVLLMGAFLPPLDFYIVNLALPAIGNGLRTTGGQLQLIVSCYASAYAVFLITGGRLGDLYGRKQMFMAGMTGFIIASAICGFAPNGSILILGRILQGASAAVMAPQVLATIRTIFSVAEQPRIIGLYGSVFGFASIVGQLFGGALITLHPLGLTWQSIFLINIPIGAVALGGAMRFLPEARPLSRPKIDLVGVFLLSLLLGSIIYPLTRGREAGWPAWTFISFAASIPLLAFFIWFEHWLAKAGGSPLVDLKLFKNRTFVAGLAMAFLFYCISVFFLTFGIYLQSGLGWTSLASGIGILPFALGFFAGTLRSAKLYVRIGNHILSVGFGLLAGGFAITAGALHAGFGPGIIFYVGLICAGVGQGLLQPSTVRIVLTEVEPEQAGLAAGVVTSILQVGAAVGVAAVGSVFFTVLGQQTGSRPYGNAFASALAVAACLQVLGMLLATKMNHRHRRAVAAMLPPGAIQSSD